MNVDVGRSRHSGVGKLHLSQFDIARLSPDDASGRMAENMKPVRPEPAIDSSSVHRRIQHRPAKKIWIRKTNRGMNFISGLEAAITKDEARNCAVQRHFTQAPDLRPTGGRGPPSH